MEQVPNPSHQPPVDPDGSNAARRLSKDSITAPMTDSTVKELRKQAEAIQTELTSLKKVLDPGEPQPRPTVGAPGGVKLRTLPTLPNEDEIRAALVALEAKLAAFRGTLDGTGTETTNSTDTRNPSVSSSAPNADLRTSFGDFISSVGRSVADAQSELDRQARHHVATSKSLGGPLLPTLYRIPKLSAEVKFAFEKETGKGLNLLFFSKKENSSEEHQQSISFDIVAVPPPPELVERLASGVPMVRLVLEPEQRERVFQVVRERAAKDLPKADRAVLDAALDAKAPTRDALRVLILESVPNSTKEYVMVLASNATSETASTDIGIWHVSLADEAKVATALRFTQGNIPKVNQGPLRSLMATLGDQQAKALAAAAQAPTT